MHTTLDPDRFLADLHKRRSKIGILASSTPIDQSKLGYHQGLPRDSPSDIDKLWSEAPHPFYTIIQILQTLQNQLWPNHELGAGAYLSGTRREELEGPVSPAFPLGFRQLFRDFHIVTGVFRRGGVGVKEYKKQSPTYEPMLTIDSEFYKSRSIVLAATCMGPSLTRGGSRCKKATSSNGLACVGVFEHAQSD